MNLIEEQIESYLQSKEGLWADESIRCSRSRLKLCLMASEELDPRALFTHFKKMKLNLYSIQTYLITASRFELWLHGTRKIADFMVENAFTFRHAYKEKTRRMTQEDFVWLLRLAPNWEVYNFLVLMGRAGLRKSEALRAKWSDVDKGSLLVIGKGGRQRRVPLSSKWLKEVVSEKICGDNCNGYQAFFKKMPDWTPHDLRAFYATQVSNHPELSMKDAQMLLGHSSIVTTQRYVRADYDNAKRVLLDEG